MIVGIGVDCVDKNNISLQDKIFIEHTFSDMEQKEAETHYDSAMYFAERFAVKEAVFKALNDIVPNYNDIRLVETKSAERGKPITTFLDNNFSKNYQIHVSITNEHNLAIAFVVVEDKKDFSSYGHKKYSDY